MNEAAFEALYAATSRPLWAYLRRVTGDAALADDLLQETYLRFLRRAPRCDGKRPDAYLFRIASNLMRDRWRRSRRERGLLERLLAAPERQQAHAPPSGLRADMEAVLGQIRPQERALLWLAHVEGYDHREIAEILDLKAGSIRVMLFRARKKVARALEQAPGAER